TIFNKTLSPNGFIIIFPPFLFIFYKFYVLFSQPHTLDEVRKRVLLCCDFALNYEGKLPGESSKECGNYKDLNLLDAKYIAQRLKTILTITE
ncbi:MAG: S-ribosylhomocysteine lyase, partial [Paludibacteraceae bacterium]|nr:S-ribosylhomocysteine lyase [Paludibacteraceae bacterium]